MLIEFGIALRDNDPAARERKFGDLMRVLGGTIPVKELAAGTMDPDAVLDEEPQTIANATWMDVPKIKPVPANLTIKSFKEYWSSEFKKLTNDQKEELLKRSGFEAWTGENAFKMTKSNYANLVSYFTEIAGCEAPVEPQELTADNMREEINTYYLEQDGNAPMLDAILAKHSIGADTDFNLIPDETMRLVYLDFKNELQYQKGVSNQNATS
jgi:hypothetical protein